MSTRIEPVLTVADLDSMPDDGKRYEIVDGELLVSRTPTLAHQTVSANLLVLIRNFLAVNPIGEVWATPGVVLSEFDAVIPDLAFVSSERRTKIALEDRIMGAPDLVIEIVSPGAENERRDRIAKRQTYGKYGVKEYLVADYQKRTIEVYLFEENSLKLQWILSDEDELTSSVLPSFRCKVEDVFRR